MPKRKRSRSRSSKKRAKYMQERLAYLIRRARIPRRRPARSLRIPVGFPKKTLMKLRYVEEVNLPKYNAAPQCFGLNCLFQPNLSTAVGTGSSHQPRGFDELATVYDKYCVISAKATVELLQVPVTATVGTNSYPTCFMHLDDSIANDGLTLPQHLELGMKNKYTIVARQYGATNAGGFALPARKKTIKFGIRKFFGISKKTQIIQSRKVGDGDESVANHEYDALFTANPASHCVLKLKMFNTDASDDAAIARVVIDYTVVAFDPLELSQS